MAHSSLTHHDRSHRWPFFLSPDARRHPAAAARPATEQAQALARNWWTVLLRGMCALAFGLLVLLAPGAEIAVLSFLFAAYMLLDALFAMTSGARGAGQHGGWPLFVVQGTIHFTLGVLAFLSPEMTDRAFVWLLTVWGISAGLLGALAATRLPVAYGRWLLAAAAAGSLLYGMLLAALPVPEPVPLSGGLGLYAVSVGALTMALGIRLHHRRPAKA